MAIECYPLEGSDITTELQWSRLSRMYSADGVEGVPTGTSLKVTAGAGLNLNIAAGQGLVRGIFVRNTAVETRGVPTNPTSSPRVDKVVFRVNTTTHSGDFVVIPGTPAATPVAPAATYTDTVFDLPLADVRVEASDVFSTIADRRQFLPQYGVIPATSQGRPNTRGMPGIAFETDTNRVVSTKGDGNWFVGLGDDLYRPQMVYAQAGGTVSSTAYTATLLNTPAGSAVMDMTFTTPPSGRVRIAIEAVLINRGTDIKVTCNVQTVAGAAVVTNDELTITQARNPGGSSCSAFRHFTLAPNTAHLATLRYRLEEPGIGEVHNRGLEVWPLP